MKRPGSGYQTIESEQIRNDEVDFGDTINQGRRHCLCVSLQTTVKDIMLLAVLGTVLMLSLCYNASNIYESFAMYRLKFELDGPTDNAFDELNGTMQTSSRGQSDCEGTVIIIRHCEKKNNHVKKSRNYKHCNFIGFERSYYIATLFGDGNERYPKPSFVYSMGTSRKHNHVRREVETVIPLADKAGIPINENYYTGDEAKLSTDVMRLLQDKALCGKIAVISWEHSGIPVLARALGCYSSMGCPRSYNHADYDSIWQIKYVYSESLFGVKGAKNYEWEIYGTTTRELFDPLHFSKAAGDYPPGGTDKIGRWAKNGFETSLRRNLMI